MINRCKQQGSGKTSVL